MAIAAHEDSFARDVAQGLSAAPKRLPPKWFYDAAGSALFEEICGLPEYYLTRAEREILEANAAELAGALAPNAAVVELGPGSAKKTALVLEKWKRDGSGCFVGVDLSAAALESARATLAAALPSLRVHLVLADFFGALDGPLSFFAGPRALLFMGSNVGNLDAAEQRAFCKRVRALLAPGDVFILGADLVKDERALVAAYDDAQGVTARFDLNVLARMNRELGARFDLAGFRHVARWNAELSRIEMHLESLARQEVPVAALARTFRFEAGETIHTESSHKFTREGLAALAAQAGFAPERVWTDGEGRFAVSRWRAR